MWDRIWDTCVDFLMHWCMPLISSYYLLSANVFLNTSCRDATRLECLGDVLLSPTQYILAGKEAIQREDGSWELVQRFDYEHAFWYKITASVLTLPASLILGSAVKAISFAQKEVRERHHSILVDLQSSEVRSNLSVYEQMGICTNPIEEKLCPLGCRRRSGDEQVLHIEKQALREIGEILNEAKIPWWVDCGTCLGAYRYGGVIPWDGDIDIAVLLPDFENVRHALNRLDPERYMVQDWSSREFPNSYLKVLIRESRTLIDIYHFAIDPKQKEIRYILSLENNIFFPEWWKIRERRFKVPVAFDVLFPLKKADFDGIEVFVPNNTEKYLQRCYGENLAPVKIYDPVTNRYEKDLSHPYWQRVYAH